MNVEHLPPRRTDIWKEAAWFALIAATVTLVIIKLFTAIAFMAAAIVAVAAFMIAFAFAIRLSPRRYQ